jgi:glycosyltransferase involved in cell wall biosynthesis
MKKITLAIPFYNTSQYFLECIQYALENEFVSEIVVNDDCSDEDQWKKLNQIVDTLNTDKIKLFRNKENLGAFRNKYTTVLNCSNTWVYLLDSDNHVFENSYDSIKSISNVDPLIIYSPQHLCCKNDDSENYEVISDYNFKYDLIGIEETKDMIFKKTKWFDWFFNSGNYVLNKDTYINALKKPYEDKSTPLLDADTAAAFYFLLEYGVKFKIIENFSHHHRLRKDSTWHTCGENSQLSVNYYQNLFIEL